MGTVSNARRKPLAQLGVGPDGNSVLARAGQDLVEIVTPSFSTDSPRWAAMEARVRTIQAVEHPAIRRVVAVETAPPAIVLEGDTATPLAELLGRAKGELARMMNLVSELASALAIAHRAGIVHGGLHPWSIDIAPGDHPRIELLGLSTRATSHSWLQRCRAPESIGGQPEAAGDVYALGALLELYTDISGETHQGVQRIISQTTMADPDDRPTAASLVTMLVGAPTVVAALPTGAQDGARTSSPSEGMKIGRFELTRRLGSGAMGEVWQARDTTGGPDVAIKLLHPQVATDPDLLRRFRKEGRVLTKVGSPYIANYIDLNEDAGYHYLVLELVPGGSVAGALRRVGKLGERLALGVIADTCRALAEPHRLGIVHRDIKPDNLMFVRAGLDLEDSPSGQVVKLGDFGIARIVESGPKNAPGATREGSVLGTPEFMAPEQADGAQVTPATDVYALGCCLFALIAGRPPFVAQTQGQMDVLLKHVHDAPPRLDEIEPDASPAVADLVARLLVKDPRHRPQDASEVLVEIERLCDATAGLIAAHPAAPVVNERAIQTYTFEWELASSAEALWPFVSNTEKMNRATGLAPVRFEVETSTLTMGHQRIAGVELKWREHPFEWIEGNRHVVLRVFEKGPLRWYVAQVDLERLPSGGTKLRNTIRMEPRGLFGRVVSRWELGVKYRNGLDRVYRRLDHLLSTGARPEIDPIEPEVVLPAATRARVTEAMARLGDAKHDPRAVDALLAYLLHASDQDLARIRPLELAQRFGVREEAMVDVCLHATKQGVLEMVWDVICASCRIPSSVLESMQKIEEHASCRTCNIEFDVDFARNVELAFRAAADIRTVETRTFCIGGPAHFPHVAAQVRLQPGERVAIPLQLAPGLYIVRSPQQQRGYDVRVISDGGVRRVDIALGERAELPALTSGDQLVTLVNPGDSELVVRVERVGDRANALTAARAMATAVFRELFPDEQLAPGRLISITQSTLVVAVLDEAAALFHSLGDEKAFPVASRFFAIVGECAKAHGGAIVKTFSGLAIAAFERPVPAVEAALALQGLLAQDPVSAGLRCCVAVHRGSMLALTQAARLDYFGQNVELALALAPEVPAGLVGLTSAVCQDVAVADRLQTITDRHGMTELGEGQWVLHVRGSSSSASA